MEDIDLGFEHGAHESTPVWAVFGDLMSGLLAACRTFPPDGIMTHRQARRRHDCLPPI